MQQPVINSNRNLLRAKLREIDGCSVDKRIGRNNTYVFLIERKTHDPTISVLSDEFLRNFILRRKNRPKAHELTIDKQQLLSNQQNEQQHPKHQNTPQPPQRHRIKVVQKKQKLEKGNRNQKQQQQQHQQTANLEPRERVQINLDDSDEEPIRRKAPSEQPFPKTKQRPRSTSNPTQPTPPRQPTPSPSPSPPPPPPPPPLFKARELTPISFAQGTIDRLIIREDVQDEFAYLNNDDDEEETQLSKNLRKIRTEPPAQKSSISRGPNTPNLDRILDRFPPARNKATPEAGPSASETAPHGMNSHDDQSSPRQQQAQNQGDSVITEHNWDETEAKLKQFDLDNTYNDLYHHKDKIKSSEKAKELLKKLVLECIRREETKWLPEALNLIFELIELYRNDVEFWKELAKRLQTKLNPVAKYRAHVDHDYVRGIFKNALSNLSQFLFDNDVPFPSEDFTFRNAVFLATPTALNNEEKSGSNLEPKVEKKENSDPILGERRVSQSDKKFPIFQSGGRQFPMFNIKRELKRERPSTGVRQ